MQGKELKGQWGSGRGKVRRDSACRSTRLRPQICEFQEFRFNPYGFACTSCNGGNFDLSPPDFIESGYDKLMPQTFLKYRESIKSRITGWEFRRNCR